ncbi:hypothetical protein ACG2LH_01910 [Zhouia sp. PK063]|uniref:hypothetical protein n=1 Tax=Zhouia sp. PK063 TaxID=3373602 RepID=UPI00378CD6FF
MARINSRNRITGTLGNMVLKTVNQQTIVQSRPGKGTMKQTAATKASATDFGINSTNAKMMYMAQNSIVQHMADGTMAYRFRTATYQGVLADTAAPKGQKQLWNGDVSVLQHFEFNVNSPYMHWVKVLPQITYTAQREVQLVIPAFKAYESIQWLPRAQRAVLCYMVSAHHPTSFALVQQQLLPITISGSNAVIAATTLQSNPILQQSLVMVSGVLWWYRDAAQVGSFCMNSKTCNPAMVLQSFKAL